MHLQAIGIIFDNDGVLVDSENFSETAYRQAMREQGVEVDPADAELYCGLTDADILKDMEQRYQRSLDFPLFSTRKRDLYFEAAEAAEMRVFPGVKDLLDQLCAANIPVALASSASREKIAFNLRRSGLHPYFQHIVSGEDFERGKPDPQIFLAAASRLNLPASGCVVIEDSINGLKAANAAGMLAIGVTNSFPADKLRNYADHVVTSLAELNVPAIQTWMTARPATL